MHGPVQRDHQGDSVLNLSRDSCNNNSLYGHLACHRKKSYDINRLSPRKRFAMEFVVIKHFGRESFHVESSCGLDVVEYMLKCVFCWQIPPEIQCLDALNSMPMVLPISPAQLSTPKENPEKLSEPNLKLRYPMGGGIKRQKTTI